jgi:hypothetical protein
MDSSAFTPILASFPADEIRMPLSGVEASLIHIRTLLDTIADLVEHHSAKVGRVSASATRDGFYRIATLVDVALAERQRAENAFSNCDDVIIAHLVEEAA